MALTESILLKSKISYSGCKFSGSANSHWKGERGGQVGHSQWQGNSSVPQLLRMRSLQRGEISPSALGRMKTPAPSFSPFPAANRNSQEPGLPSCILPDHMGSALKLYLGCKLCSLKDSKTASKAEVAAQPKSAQELNQTHLGSRRVGYSSPGDDQHYKDQLPSVGSCSVTSQYSYYQQQLLYYHRFIDKTITDIHINYYHYY